MEKDPIVDDDLGTLQWDGDVDGWVSQQSFSREQIVRVAIVPEGAAIEAVLQRTRGLCQRLRRDDTAFRDTAADELLEVHNDSWNEGPPISRAEFIDRMRLREVSVSGELCASLGYDDGDLFWGHTIVVAIDKDDGVIHVELYG